MDARLRHSHFALWAFGNHLGLQLDKVFLLKVTSWGAGACELEVSESGDQTLAALNVPRSAASSLCGLLPRLGGPWKDLCFFAFLFAFRTWPT